MAMAKYNPDEIVAKLRQVDTLTSLGQSVAEAVQSIGVTKVTYDKWLAQYGGLIRTLAPSSEIASKKSKLH
jgi:putative transposase